MLRRLFVCAFVVSLAAAAACREAPAGVGPISAAGGITPMCQLGCVEVDSYPTKPGVFLGSGVTPETCVNGGYTDADQDGLGDFCEEQLSYAFRPELYHSSADNVGREPYWVARVLDEDRVRIGYLLSYYRDEGCPAWVCHLPCPTCDPSAAGHNGDSEGIYLDLYYHRVAPLDGGLGVQLRSESLDRDLGTQVPWLDSVERRGHGG